MERLNLSLDRALLKEIAAFAKAEDCSVAMAARHLIREALRHRRRRELQRLMAASYAAGAKDPEELESLRAMQAGQDEILRREK